MFVCKACSKRGFATTAWGGARALQHPRHASLAVGAASRRAAPPASDAQAGPPAQADEEVDPIAKRRAEKLEWVVKKHLQYLKDPLKIAEHVKATLDKDKFDEALLLTRNASRDALVTVSWNHLIDYQMKQQRLHGAIKLYNEMKKRAQFPDARTYTIIFRGCAASVHPKLAVSEAMRIYMGMASSQRIQPSIIHLNAVLEVCNRAGDLESMFTMLKNVNDKARTPDSQTFTIVLNALRHDIGSTQLGLGDREGLGDKAKDQLRDGALMKAKMIWEDVSTRWKDGRLVIDENLVCAMGRILVAGDSSDKGSVGPLLEETMRIPRFDVGSGLLGGGESQQGPGSTEVAKADGRYAKAGNNALSMAMEYLLATKKTSVAPKYWHHFTSVLGVRPDKDNYIKYLRVIQKGRSSAKAAEVLRAMPAEILAPYVYRMALSTCIHDELNPNAFTNACTIYDVMVRLSRYPDPLCMRLFLQSARGSVRHIYEKHDKDPEAAKLAVGQQIVSALDRMWQPFRILMSSFSYPTEQKRSQSPGQLWKLSEDARSEAMATARRMIAAMDVVVGEAMAGPEEVKVLKGRRIVLNKLVERYTTSLDSDAS